MILLVSGASQTKPRFRVVGTLVVPGAWSETHLRPGRWAMDNGAYSGFDVAAFMEMLRRYRATRGSLFVTAPDVVGDAAATLERWSFWADVIRGVGYVPALVLQDGMIGPELPWPSIGAVFVGGTTDWKLGPQAASIVAYARTRGLWCHMGRVNSYERISYAAKIGCLSFDGGQYSRFPDRRIPEGLRDIERATTRGSLFT